MMKEPAAKSRTWLTADIGETTSCSDPEEEDIYFKGAVCRM